MKMIKITLLIILLVSSVFVSGCTPSNSIDAKTAECIGQKSLLYVKEGCPACVAQKEMFGENFHYIDIVDCKYESYKCLDIQYIPTWIINSEKHTGMFNEEQLKELTGC